MKINCKYATTFIILLLGEIYIALFIHDNIIRPFVGDILVVCVIYFFLRSFISKSIKLMPVYTFLFACLIEVSQYFNLISVLHMENFKIARIIIGSTFDLKDIFCYLVGMVLIFLYESLIK